MLGRFFRKRFKNLADGLWPLAFARLRLRHTCEAQALFAGKRIALIGPADTTVGKGYAARLGEYDLIVGVNRVMNLVAEGDRASDIGTRLDLVFHNLTNRYGDFDVAACRKAGVEQIVAFDHARPWQQSNHKALRFARANPELARTHLRLLPPCHYADCAQSLGGVQPTIGYAAIRTMLEAGCARLFITGFSFFKSAYSTNYYQQLTTDRQLERFAEAKSHSPATEAEQFRELAAQYAGVLELDDYLSAMVAEPEGA